MIFILYDNLKKIRPPNIRLSFTEVKKISIEHHHQMELITHLLALSRDDVN